MKKYVYFIGFIVFIFLLSGCSLDKRVHVDALNLGDLDDTYDVIVVGGEPEGVAAAVSSARNGNKTLLVEHRDGLGGLITYGMLNFLDVSRDQHGEFANAGIFKEWHDLVGGDIGVDIPTAKDAFHQLAEDEKNLTIITETNFGDVNVENDRLTAIQLIDNNGDEKLIEAKRFIDSTQDADLAVKAGAPYFIGNEDIGLDKKMAVTLMIHLKNIDWKKIVQAAEDGVFGGAEISSNVGWGFSKLHYDYEPHNPNTRLRGLNIVKEKDGSVIINALQVFGIDGLDEEEKQKAIEVGKEETEYIVAFLRENFPGFEKAEIASMPNELYVRETRHIEAEYQLPLSDTWENKDHWDSIGFGSYPVDVQATSPDDYGYVYGRPIQYAIPFRSLVPKKIDGLLVASKASGYSSLAAASARVIPTGMTTGEAAGVAAAVSIDNEVDFRSMIEDKKLIKEVQKKLKDQGAKLYSFELDYPYKDEWFYPASRILLNYGIILGGYDNEFPVEKPITEESFANLLTNGANRMGTDEAKALEPNYTDLWEHVKKDKELTRNKAGELLLRFHGITDINENAWEQGKSEGFIDEVVDEKVSENRVLVGAEGYYLAGKTLEKLK